MDARVIDPTFLVIGCAGEIDSLGFGIHDAAILDTAGGEAGHPKVGILEAGVGEVAVGEDAITHLAFREGGTTEVRFLGNRTVQITANQLGMAATVLPMPMRALLI